MAQVKKPRKTLADYLVIAISPALIMVLVGSLGLFLVNVCYRGDLAGGVRWMLFWFVLAIVLVSRMGIEQSSAHAQVYGLLLAAATWLFLAHTHSAPLLGAVLLGVTWWCTHKLTVSCTLIDDEADASGEGVLTSAWGTPKRPVAASPDPPRSGVRAKADQKTKRQKKASPPGLWVVYFSLAALPLFGVGQMLLPADDTTARRAALGFVVAYLAAALGLLLTTSFLGLRRYLRQRYLTMPANIALGWIRFGVGLAAAVLMIAMILPRPGAATAWRTLSAQVDRQLRRASEFAMRMNAPVKSDGKTGNRPGGDQEGPSTGTGSNNETNGTGESAAVQTRGPSGELRQPGQNPQNDPRGSHRRPGDASNSLHGLLRMLTIFAMITAVGWWVTRHRALLAQMFRAFIAAVRQFINELLGIRTPGKPAPAAPARPATRVLHPFASYRNPFLTGKDRSWPTDRLVLYTFEGLQAWAKEQGIAPKPQQTPREFCGQLAEGFPDIGPDLESLSFFYAHAAFGRHMPASFQAEPFQRLWRYMRPFSAE